MGKESFVDRIERIIKMDRDYGKIMPGTEDEQDFTRQIPDILKIVFDRLIEISPNRIESFNKQSNEYQAVLRVGKDDAGKKYLEYISTSGVK